MCGTRTPNEDQFSLIRAYEEGIIPRMEEIARKESNGGTYNVVFIEQEDGAGFHNNAEYQEFKYSYLNKRNCLRRMQSAQSPLFNDLFYLEN